MERPKRRRYKDNPYRLNCIEGKYFITFKDSNNNIQNVEISLEIHNVFNSSELQDLREMNEFDNHIEHSVLIESTLHKRAIDLVETVEEIVEKKIRDEELYNAIDSLSIIQKRRIKMYYFEDKTLQEIAKIENCSIMSVKESIDTAKEKLKKILKS